MSFFVTNGNVKLAYSIIDESDGPVIFLHTGLNATKEDWDKFGYINPLKDKYKLILIDPRGQGESDKPLDLAAYNFHLLATDVVCILDNLQLDKIIYWGYSLGGIVGWHLAKYFPSKLSKLIVGGADVSHITPPNPFLNLMTLKENRENIINKKAELPQENIKDILSTIQFPCLVYGGEKDRFCYPQMLEYTKKIPECEIFTLSNANHFDGIKNSEQVLPKVLSFLEK
jgi:pimeloyl-ACP methyl ester carboxylesterase